MIKSYIKKFAPWIALLVVVIIFTTAAIIIAVTVSDTFLDETKIGGGLSGGVNANATTNVTLNSGVQIQPCYAPNPSWTLVGTSPSTHVRDLSVTANSTTYIDKDIYCDATNCILWTAGATAPGTVCIATNVSVYANVLWRKTDIGSPTTKAWANTGNASINIAGGDIGGTHTTNKAGTGSTTITNYKWLARYYTSTNGTPPYYPAMDACKALGLGWRLPTIIELDSIRDQTISGGVYTRLPAIVAYLYWSSSERSAANPFNLGFLNGAVGTGYAKSGAGSVRCVRGY